MSRSRRVLVLLVAVALACFAAPPSLSAVDPSSAATAADAVGWIGAHQQPDGGFELLGFPGFETRDAALAIAEQAQTGASWSAGQARAALGALRAGGSGGPTPLDALDDFAATVTTAGGAAKTIVLSAAPFAFDPAAFDPGGDGAAVNLVTLLDAGCAANTASFGVFTDTLYAVLAKRLVCGATPTAAVTAIRAAQQANGGWNFLGDPTGTDVDVDTTSLALQALVAAGAGPGDSSMRAALGMLAANLRPSGAWQSFGSDDPNSTALGILAITAAGYDVTSSCWRDTVAPASATSAYPSPDAWLRSQQLASGADAGRVVSPNDGFGISTFATSQAVEGLLRSWLPVVRVPQQSCGVTPPLPSTDLPIPGQSITLSGSGFAPNSAITVELHSDPVVLAHTTTDDAGAYSVVVTIPGDTAPGAHELVVVGVGVDGKPRTSAVAITVVAVKAESVVKAEPVVIPGNFTG